MIRRRDPVFFPRPTKATGWGLIFMGVLIAALNLAMDFTDKDLLPGGHSPLYFGAAVVIVLVGAIIAGQVDRFDR